MAHLDSSTVSAGGRTYTRYLLRESYREGGKVKKRTIANLSRCSPEEIEAIRLALRHKGDLGTLASITSAVELEQGLSVGAVWLLHDLAKQVGIADALGASRQGKLALWQIFARAIDQGSRLSAVRLAKSHAACDILGLEAFNEDHLYANLDWLCEHQCRIEQRLFRTLHKDQPPRLYLYDVTSVYLEGTQNACGAFGYNRDGKKGKMQIVVGLLCNEQGQPLTIEVFDGNTQDPKTLASQIRKVAERFGGDQVTFVGDRGMIKSEQVSDLLGHGFHYITAITKPQIERLLSQDVLQVGLFDQGLAEVTTEDSLRYVLRRNPVRAQEIAASRDDRLQTLDRFVMQQNSYLSEHPRAKAAVAERRIRCRLQRLKLHGFVSIAANDRHFSLTLDEVARAETAKLDGCYVLKTDLSKEIASKEEIHERYRDLALVESAFRISKTVELEARPVNVRLENHTRAHVFVVMLAYRLVQELARRWSHIELTVQEGLDNLATLCTMRVTIAGGKSYNEIPKPRPDLRELLSAARVKLPAVLPSRGVKVDTRKKLTGQRKRI